MIVIIQPQYKIGNLLSILQLLLIPKPSLLKIINLLIYGNGSRTCLMSGAGLGLTPLYVVIAGAVFILGSKYYRDKILGVGDLESVQTPTISIDRFKILDEILESENTLSRLNYEGNNIANKIDTIITNSSSSSSGSGSLSNLVSDHSFNINILPKIEDLEIDTFSSYVAFANITGVVSILFLSFAIILAFYGIKLIEYFDLENKYPKIAKYIRLRNKLQHYSIILNIVLIYALLFGIIFLNLMILYP